MKRIILIILAVICITGCDKMIVSAVDAATLDSELSFMANGESYKVTGSNTNTLRIIDSGDEGFAISLIGGSHWDTENTLESAVIALSCGFFNGELKKGEEYVYSAEEMDTYPYFKYTIREELESSDKYSTYRVKTMWYNATDGWFKITRMNKKKGIISGSFEFTAVCDDPSNGDVIEITNGVFKDISYKIIED